MTRRRLLLAAGTLLAGLLAVVVVAAVLQLVHRGEIVPSVELAGLPVGGLSAADAEEQVRALAGEMRSDSVTVRHVDRDWILDPAEVDFRVDVAATVDQLMLVGRDGGTVRNLFAHVSTLWRTEQVAIDIDVTAELLDGWLASVAGEVDQAPFPGGIEIDPETLAVTALEPREGREVDQDLLADAVLDELQLPGPAELDLPVEIVPIRITMAQVEQVADQARDALAEPMVLTHGLGDLEVAQADLARLLSLREVEGDEGWSAELHVAPGAVEEVFATRTGRYEVEPVNATWDVDRKPPVTFDDKSTTSWRKVPQALDVVPSRDGSTFDLERVAAQLADMARRAARTEPLELLILEPEFTTADAEAGRPTHLLSTFTTHHACCQSRVHNIQRLADMVDGAIVQPGEQFSINEISGERSCSKGFREAGMIRRGEIVPSCGGGVSQFGTTTFNAAFFAGVQLDEWKAHSFYISRYPMGREATINFPSPNLDVLWTNTTGKPILVKTSYTATSITVSFWGNSDVDEVEAVHGQPTRWRNWSTEYRENKNLKPGTQKTIQSGQRGFTVVVTQLVHRGNNVTEREIVTVYVPEREIIERNSDPAPSPTPKPKPSPTESDPTPTPSPTPTPEPTPTDPPDEGN